MSGHVRPTPSPHGRRKDETKTWTYDERDRPVVDEQGLRSRLHSQGDPSEGRRL